MGTTADNKGRRQSFSDIFKRAVVTETFEPGATVTAVARRHGLKPNLVFTWRTIERLLPSAPASMFLPVEVAVPAADSDRAGTPPVDPVAASLSAIERLELVLPCTTRLSISGTIAMADVAMLARSLSR